MKGKNMETSENTSLIFYDNYKQETHFLFKKRNYFIKKVKKNKKSKNSSLRKKVPSEKIIRLDEIIKNKSSLFHSKYSLREAPLKENLPAFFHFNTPSKTKSFYEYSENNYEAEHSLVL